MRLNILAVGGGGESKTNPIPVPVTWAKPDGRVRVAVFAAIYIWFTSSKNGFLKIVAHEPQFDLKVFSLVCLWSCGLSDVIILSFSERGAETTGWLID